MKRALFKMGKEFSVFTRIPKLSVEFRIEEDWLSHEDSWKVRLRKVTNRLDSNGTKIVISHLRETIQKTFGEDKHSFEAELREKIETRYSFISAKGFVVKINGKAISPHQTKFAFGEGEKDIVQPYIFSTQEDGMSVFVAVGFTAPLPDEEDPKYPPKHSGWTVICNDRAVLYCDKTIQTGWGWGGIPVHHPQYNAIAGIVEFHSDDPTKLPTTTTKNGIDMGSELYVRVLDKMREGVRPFITYTNKWKGDLESGKRFIKDVDLRDFQEVKRSVPSLGMTRVHKPITGEQYRPNLPMPSKANIDEDKISFRRKKSEVRVVSKYLFDTESEKPNKVGERCFVEMLREAKR
jgi:hypothetical protein